MGDSKDFVGVVYNAVFALLCRETFSFFGTGGFMSPSSKGLFMNNSVSGVDSRKTIC